MGLGTLARRTLSTPITEKNLDVFAAAEPRGATADVNLGLGPRTAACHRKRRWTPP